MKLKEQGPKLNRKLKRDWQIWNEISRQKKRKNLTFYKQNSFKKSMKTENSR